MKKDFNGILIGSQDFVKGVADSAFIGFEEMRNVDLTNEGIIQPNFTTTQVSDTVGDDAFTGMPTKIVTDPNTGYLWTLTDNHLVYFSTDSGSTWGKLVSQPASTGAGNGMEIWKDYLFIFGNTRIDIYSLSGGTWTNNALTTGALVVSDAIHPSIHATDDVLYIGAGNKLISLTENSGQTFAPGTSATYTLEQAALTLPSGQRIRTINELGNYLMLGTWISASTLSGKIYPWGHFSLASSYEKPIDLQEKGIRAAVTVGNYLYVIAGDKGNIYVCSQAEGAILKKLPIGLLDLQGQGLFDVKTYAILYDKGRILFGNNTTAATLTGIWSYDIKKDRLVFENQLSDGNVGDDNITIGCLYPSIGSNGILIGWFSNALNGIDQVSGSTRYSAYKTNVKTALFKVGTKDEPATFNKLEIQLTETTTTGDKVRVGYRTVNSGAFTTIATLETESVTSYSVPIAVINVENIQLQIEMGGNAKILEIRLTRT